MSLKSRNLRIAITSGEPAGIGPDLIVRLLENLVLPFELVIVADQDLLQQRAHNLAIPLHFDEFDSQQFRPKKKQHCSVLNVPLRESVTPGKLNRANGEYVVDILRIAGEGCLKKLFAAVVTAPVQKSIINEAGIHFSGHTEFFAELANVPEVVMMLMAKQMRVALVTTHLPLAKVAAAISKEKLTRVITILNNSLQKYFDINNPTIFVAGLNPHAGEQGQLGREEIDVIIPTLNQLRSQGMQLIGPLPADTMFLSKNIKQADAFLMMYHDQGLPVLKFYGFEEAVNVTLGLPFIRTSVDHGTALELAGTAQASLGSFEAALQTAIAMVQHER